MKWFEVPEIEVIYFTPNDIIITSCECDDCPTCEEGSNDCQCNDSWSSDYKPNGAGIQGFTPFQ